MTAVATAAKTEAARGAGPVELAYRQGVIEVKQFLRSRESVVFTMAFPVIMIFIFASIFTWNIAPGVKFTQYFITGMIATGLMTVGFQSLAIQIPMERDKGILKRLRGTPMPKWVYFAGKSIMVLAIGLAEMVILLAVSA
ncbi:MAG: ABC transporter permease, partial [Micromonosporaceae bacterium]|nr:ABC transporter permease [Micromonosporaceae bacterium]